MGISVLISGAQQAPRAHQGSILSLVKAGCLHQAQHLLEPGLICTVPPAWPLSPDEVLWPVSLWLSVHQLWYRPIASANTPQRPFSSGANVSQL